MIFAIIAQVAENVISQVSPLYSYGPLGIITGFFMLASYKLLGLGSKLIVAIREDGADLRKEIKSLTHRTDGLQRALWADLVERENCGVRTKQFARQEIAKIDSRLEKLGP